MLGSIDCIHWKCKNFFYCLAGQYIGHRGLVHCHSWGSCVTRSLDLTPFLRHSMLSQWYQCDEVFSCTLYAFKKKNNAILVNYEINGHAYNRGELPSWWHLTWLVHNCEGNLLPWRIVMSEIYQKNNNNRIVGRI
jgi:hypothetical protein